MTNAFTTSGLFGGLFSDAEIAAEFGSDAFTARMLEFEKAWTQALGACGVVSASDAQVALDAIAGFEGVNLGAGSERDGLPVPALVDALRSGLPDGIAKAIHTGSTSQDVIDTAMVLSCLSVLATFETRLRRVLAQIGVLLTQFGKNDVMARTRMQAALPTNVALRLEAWRRPLADHLARAGTLREALSVVQVGGPIGARDTPNAYVAECAPLVATALGLSFGPVWHADRSKMIEFGHWLTLVTGTLGKIGQDAALMAQQGVDEIAFSSGGGSSAMAHKKNPISAETIVALARFVAGQQGILGQAMIYEQERSGVAWSLEWLTLPAMAEATGAALNNAEKMLASITRIGAQS